MIDEFWSYPELLFEEKEEKRRKNYKNMYILDCLGGTIPKTNEIVKNICSCHNFFPLSSVQIIFIPACCLLCVL